MLEPDAGFTPPDPATTAPGVRSRHRRRAHPGDDIDLTLLAPPLQ
jgi:hypothetical protein